MSIELTEQQQAELDDPHVGLHKVINRRTNSVYILVPEAEYESIREILEDEREQKALRAVGLANAVNRADEGL